MTGQGYHTGDALIVRARTDENELCCCAGSLLVIFDSDLSISEASGVVEASPETVAESTVLEDCSDTSLPLGLLEPKNCALQDRAVTTGR